MFGQFYATNIVPVTFDHDCLEYSSIIEYPMHVFKSIRKPFCSKNIPF